MKTLILACAASLALAGCGSWDRAQAEDACRHLVGTPHYGECYAAAYNAARDRSVAGGAAMMGYGSTLLTAPTYTYNRTVPNGTTCRKNPYSGDVICQSF